MLVAGSQRAALLDASAHLASQLMSPIQSEPAAAAACPGAQTECSSACPRQTDMHDLLLKTSDTAIWLDKMSYNTDLVLCALDKRITKPI